MCVLSYLYNLWFTSAHTLQCRIHIFSCNLVLILIEASPSKPHISVTALSKCVFVRLFVSTNHLRWISNEHIQIFHKDRYCVYIACIVKASGGLLSECSVTLYLVAEVASGFNYTRARDSAHDLLTPGMYDHSSCPNWQRRVTKSVAIHVSCAMTIASTIYIYIYS